MSIADQSATTFDHFKEHGRHKHLGHNGRELCCMVNARHRAHKHAQVQKKQEGIQIPVSIPEGRNRCGLNCLVAFDSFIALSIPALSLTWLGNPFGF